MFKCNVVIILMMQKAVEYGNIARRLSCIVQLFLFLQNTSDPRERSVGAYPPKCQGKNVLMLCVRFLMLCSFATWVLGILWKCWLGMLKLFIFEIRLSNRKNHFFSVIEFPCITITTSIHNFTQVKCVRFVLLLWRMTTYMYVVKG